LIVVIAILGILAAIAIPRFTASRQNAERSTVEANLRTIDRAIMVYIAEKGSTTALTKDNLVSDYLAAWPEGPGTAEYSIKEDPNGSGQYRAFVKGNVGGKEFSSETKLEDLNWDNS
jgi:type II secretory pathway pseudopilin PulG